ncbi:hypothetical protein OEIGOIKO_08208 [Streptomyces chrestomyceticus JCM 4735]|uniref:Uncharacterized protein n=1 Tax=Streptomyces chrestomyceticus JCM 4735 TaxID=1306181 RepID=A0A7U9L4R5_9ACTN|nr:hypothetical protein [Streptomyces chrestomyceticus]GCD40348.1 hypothetical protein OEIGOIKO_08208 [Streptomyces chrestomyceticus JCM 4735]
MWRAISPWEAGDGGGVDAEVCQYGEATYTRTGRLHHVDASRREPGTS